MLLRTMISVNQLSICGALADLCKELDEISSEDSTEDSFQDSESQGTQCKRNIKDETVTPRRKQCLKMQDAHVAETRQSLRPIRPEHQQRQRQNQQFEGRENFAFSVDPKTGWRHYREPRGNQQAATSSLNFEVANFTMANELELMATYIIWEMVVISVSSNVFQKIEAPQWVLARTHGILGSVRGKVVGGPKNASRDTTAQDQKPSLESTVFAETSAVILSSCHHTW